MNIESGLCHYVVSYKIIFRDGRVYKSDEFIFSSDDPTEYLADFKRRIHHVALGCKKIIFTSIEKFD